MKFVDFIKMWVEKSILAEQSGQVIFVEYAAHVKVLRVRIYVNGWNSGTKPDIDFEFDAW